MHSVVSQHPLGEQDRRQRGRENGAKIRDFLLTGSRRRLPDWWFITQVCGATLPGAFRHLHPLTCVNRCRVVHLLHIGADQVYGLGTVFFHCAADHYMSVEGSIRRFDGGLHCEASVLSCFRAVYRQLAGALWVLQVGHTDLLVHRRYNNVLP